MERILSRGESTPQQKLFLYYHTAVEQNGYLYLVYRYVNYTKKREERDAFCEISRDFVKVLFLLCLLHGLMKGIPRGRGKASL